jgi:hypothetical protein
MEKTEVSIVECGRMKTYCAHENALSRASRLPPINGFGGSGS